MNLLLINLIHLLKFIKSTYESLYYNLIIHFDLGFGLI